MYYFAILAYLVLVLFVSLKLINLAKTHEKFYEPSLKSIEQLNSEYVNWERFAIIPLFISAPLVGFISWLLMSFFVGIFITPSQADIFILSPNPAYLALPALFLGIVGATIPMHLLYKSLLGNKRYGEYTEYIDLKHNMDGFGLMKWLAAVVVPICLFFFGLGLDSYTRFQENRLKVNDLWGFGERVYYYSEIEKATWVKSFKSPNGNVVRRYHFVLHFNNGDFYNFDKTTSQPDFKVQKEIMDFIQNNTDLTIDIDDPY